MSCPELLRQVIRIALFVAFVVAVINSSIQLYNQEKGISQEYISNCHLPSLSICPGTLDPQGMYPRWISGQNQTLTEFYKLAQPLQSYVVEGKSFMLSEKYRTRQSIHANVNFTDFVYKNINNHLVKCSRIDFLQNIDQILNFKASNLVMKEKTLMFVFMIRSFFTLIWHRS